MGLFVVFCEYVLFFDVVSLFLVREWWFFVYYVVDEVEGIYVFFDFFL